MQLSERDVTFIQAWLTGYAEAKGVKVGELLSQVGRGLTVAGEGETDYPVGIVQPKVQVKRGPYEKRSKPVREGQTVHGAPLKVGTFWSRLTPAERSAEMKRRQRVAAGVEPPRRKRPSGLKRALKGKGFPVLKERGFPVGGVA